MLSADLIFLPVAFHHHTFLLMLSSIQFYRKNRNIYFCPWLSLIYDKIKPACIEQIVILAIILKNMCDTHFFLNRAFMIGIQNIIQCMIQILQKSLFRFRAIRFNSECP